MFDQEFWIKVLGLTVVVAPVLLLATLGIASLIGHPLPERIIGRLVQTAIVTGLLASLTILGMMLSLEYHHAYHNVPIELGNWVTIGHDGVSVSKLVATAHDHTEHAHNSDAPHYHFAVRFVFDRLSVPFVILTFILCGTIGAFANRYMHREKGFNRFFVLFSFFVLGMVVTSLAGTIETLFAGWELVGLSSALLVAFYQDRPAPVRNGLRVWTVYRVSDAALLLASVVLHHLTGEGNFSGFLGAQPWPDGITALTANQALLVGCLLLIAAMGKSALVPFSGWLPRAMEGPTPSSAVFYGALSVHLGAFLLLRASPLLEVSPLLRGLVVGIGVITAIYAAVAGRVQTDIKGALSFASLTQVGIIVAEIGLGLEYLALIHILGHASLRTLQFLRAPSILHDIHTMENAIGEHLPHRQNVWE
ncbi:MAG TPA: proton-conducting transporter membrane subunit, partial [Pirellulaceae bacterium]|nr:proton-conducting transporter membrane subunit [Pirellulaceae bacterium]